MAEMTGQQIYDNFHNGAGTDGLTQGADIVNQVMPRYTERALQIQRIVAEMEPHWQGDAAEGAKHGAAPMLSAHNEATEKFYTAQDLLGRQAGSFHEAKNKVVPMPPAPTEVQPWILASPGASATHQKQVGEHNSAAQHNVDTMNGFSGASDFNTTNMPTFGTVSDDHSGLSVVEPDTIDSGSFDESDEPDGGDAGPRGSSAEPGPSSRGDTPAGDSGAGSESAPPPVRSGGDTPGTTTPDAHTPTTGGTPNTPLNTTDLGRPAPATGGGPGIGIGLPVGGGGSHGGGRGAGGGAPRGGSVGGQAPRGGAGAGAEPHGPGARPTPTTGPAAARGGGATGMGGMPMGGGRGRGDEDTERKTPEYLEGGDPYELFDSDLKVAPPTIGDEDDD